MTKTNVLKCAMVGLLFAVPLSAPGVAATASVEARVTRTLATSETDDEGNVKFGGCMVELDTTLATQAPNLSCPGRWVTLSCSGDFATRSNAMRMLDSAQLAFVSNRRLRLYVNDELKHNGRCFAYRVDVLSS